MQKKPLIILGSVLLVALLVAVTLMAHQKPETPKISGDTIYWSGDMVSKKNAPKWTGSSGPIAPPPTPIGGSKPQKGMHGGEE